MVSNSRIHSTRTVEQTAGKYQPHRDVDEVVDGISIDQLAGRGQRQKGPGQIAGVGVRQMLQELGSTHHARIKFADR